MKRFLKKFAYKINNTNDVDSDICISNYSKWRTLNYAELSNYNNTTINIDVYKYLVDSLIKSIDNVPDVALFKPFYPHIS